MTGGFTLLADLLTFTPIARVTGLYALLLLAIALYWLRRIYLETRQGRVPRAAWWGMPGLLLLLFAPILEQPTFFALGTFALLIAEFWSGAYRRAGLRPGWVWPLLGLLLGVLLLVSVTRRAEPQLLALATGVGLTLTGLAGLLIRFAWPRPSVAVPQVWPRWAEVKVPEWPDLSVSLTSRGAELKNISKNSLFLSGWSPARVNGWLLVRDDHGHPLRTLAAGQTAFLPLNEYASGVRVWYRVSDHGQALLFRADWTPPRTQLERVLN